MSLVPVNLATPKESMCWVCSNQSSSFSRMIINCDCLPQGVHEDCLVQSIYHIQRTNALGIKQSDEFPGFEYYTCPHCEKAVYFRPDLSYSYKNKFKASDIFLLLAVSIAVLIYAGMMILIAIEMPDDLWAFMSIEALLLLMICLSVGALVTEIRTKFYWFYEGLQLERRSIGVLRPNLA